MSDFKAAIRHFRRDSCRFLFPTRNFRCTNVIPFSLVFPPFRFLFFLCFLGLFLCLSLYLSPPFSLFPTFSLSLLLIPFTPCLFPPIHLYHLFPHFLYAILPFPLSPPSPSLSLIPFTPSPLPPFLPIPLPPSPLSHPLLLWSLQQWQQSRGEAVKLY